MFIFEALAERLRSDPPLELPVGDKELRALTHSLSSFFLHMSTALSNRKSIMESVATILSKARPLANNTWRPVTILKLLSLFKAEYYDLDASEWSITTESMFVNLKTWLTYANVNLPEVCPVLASAFVDGQLELSMVRDWDPENGSTENERDIAWATVLLSGLVADGSEDLSASQLIWPAINKGLSNTAGAILTKSFHKADHVSRALLLLESGCLIRQLTGLGNGDLVVLDQRTQQLMPVPPNIESMLSSAMDFSLFHIRTLLDAEANDGTNGSKQTSSTYAATISQLRTFHLSFPSRLDWPVLVFFHHES